MELRITHETRYDYTPAVETAQHMVHLQPLDTPCQQLLGHRLDIFPAPAQRSRTPDVYGNQRTFFSLQTPHTTLRVVAVSEVRTHPPAVAESRLTWEAVRERFRFHAGAAWDAAAEFVFASHHVPRAEQFAAYARPSFAPGTAADRRRSRPDDAHPHRLHLRDHRAPRSTPRRWKRWPSARACARTSPTS